MVASRRRTHVAQESLPSEVVVPKRESMKKNGKVPSVKEPVKNQKKAQKEPTKKKAEPNNVIPQSPAAELKHDKETRKRRAPIKFEPEDDEKNSQGGRRSPAKKEPSAKKETSGQKKKRPRMEQKPSESKLNEEDCNLKTSDTEELQENAKGAKSILTAEPSEEVEQKVQPSPVSKTSDSSAKVKQEEAQNRPPTKKAPARGKKLSKAQKPPKQDEDEWENFGNTSDEDGSESPPEPPTKKMKKKKKVTKSKSVKPKNPKKAEPDFGDSGDAVRRSDRNVVRKSYVIKDDDDDDQESPSSSSASESESEVPSSVEASSEEPDSETEVSSVDEDPEDSDASFVPSKAKQSKRSSVEKSGSSGRPQNKSSKTERKSHVSSKGGKSTAGKSTKSRGACSAREATILNQPQQRPASSKPLKPWQKTSQPVVLGDIVVPARMLRRGERKMLKFRIIAAALAVGRHREMTHEESCKIVDGMKAKCVPKNGTAAVTSSTENGEQAKEDASSSEDEWEEMELVDTNEAKSKHVQITLKKAEEKDWWAIYLRQEVNKCVRDNWEIRHKVNILCYIGHLQYLRKVALEESLIPSLMLTKMPSGYQGFVGEVTVEKARKIVKYFHSSFKASGAPITYEPGLCRFDATARLAEMVSQDVFENDVDRAVLLFALFVSMECIARICVNTQVMPRTWDKAVLKQIAMMKKRSESASATAPKKPKSKEGSKKKSTGADYRGMIRNYWVEYWDKKQNRWICVDPLRGAVDEPNSVEENMTKPVVYVFAIDSEGGVREVTARYASDYPRPEFRRRRTDPMWLCSTLRKKMIRADPKRAQLEDVHMRQEIVNKPLPATLSEYKNHPLYVLEKDLLKFEGLYPKAEDQKPLGEVRGHLVYPRSTVYTLQTERNWIKMARSVKEGEAAYKVVKARPNLRIPAEQREQTYVDVFGYWQTEPYRRPVVKDGRIPCNEFGNVYMYVPSMCPIGAVHLRLPGLVSIARRLGGLECVPALTGWDFNSGTNFPIIDGACVLEEDADKFINEWKRLEATKEERENKRREERVLGNWKKLIRGILRLHYVKSKFGATKEKAKGRKKKDKDVKEEKAEKNCVIDRTVMAERQIFTHDDLMKLKN
ncbi:hypothetical protein V3C99_009139 [Haemonchus contortus]